jgi:hypothetical protein
MIYFFNFWDIIDKFKPVCRLKGWKTFEHEDLVNAEGKYHYFVLVHQVHLETFKRIVANTRQYFRDGNLYRGADVSYIALISQMAIPESVVSFLISKPSLLGKVALYDMNPLYEGKGFCLGINETDSSVFREFEDFLLKHGFSIKSLKEMPSLTH